MILVVTNRDDLTADWLILELSRRGVDFVRFNTEDFLSDTVVQWSLPDPPRLVIRGHEYDLAGVKSVWYRRPVSPLVPSAFSPALSLWIEGEARELLEAIWRAQHDALWVNHPDRNAIASSKPHQLGVAARLGFDVPATVVTNSPEAAHAFARAHPDGIVCKPLRSGRIEIRDESQLFFTTLMSASDLEALDEVGPEPYIFQELIRKRYDIRTTVIGTQAFSVRIHSQTTAAGRIDWRRARPEDLHHEIEDLPNEVRARSVDLVRYFGLEFGAIDFAVDGDGRYVFLEINPNGQWAWIEQLTGLPLRATLTEHLLRRRVNG